MLCSLLGFARSLAILSQSAVGGRCPAKLPAVACVCLKVMPSQLPLHSLVTRAAHPLPLQLTNHLPCRCCLPLPLPPGAAITPGPIRDRRTFRLGGSRNPRVTGAVFEVGLAQLPVGAWAAFPLRWGSILYPPVLTSTASSGIEMRFPP